MKKDLCIMVVLTAIAAGSSSVAASQTNLEREQTQIDIAINDALVGAMVGYLASVKGTITMLEALNQQGTTLADQLKEIRESYLQSPRVPSMIDPLLEKLTLAQQIIEESRKGLEAAQSLR